MKTNIQKIKHELDEKLDIMESRKYPEWLERKILNETLNILTSYYGNDFEKQMNRYLIMEVRYK